MIGPGSGIVGLQRASLRKARSLCSTDTRAPEQRGGEGAERFFLSARLGMDGRIFFVDGRQLSAIRTQDLPQLTTGIVGYERGLVNVERCYKRQVAYVRLWARTYEMFVLKNDWAKIIPLLKSGALNPAVVAPGSVLAAVNQDTDLASISVWDARFYQKVYQTLQLVFTESYPTSRL